MKILIITYSREVNPGTFLQAYEVQYVFHRLYPDARIDLIKHKRIYTIAAEKNTDNAKDGKFSFIKAKVRAIPRRLKYEWAYRTKFHLTGQEFDFFEYDETEFKAFAEGYDLIVVGSDTILIKLEKDGHYGLMWLVGVETRKVLFAASAAPVNFRLTDKQREELNRSFRTFGFLGVRDSVTKDLLSKQIGLGDAVCEQYDPTYLIPENKFSLPFYLQKKLRKIRTHRQIALVNFAVVGCPFKKELTMYLKGQGYYVVSTLYNEDADCNLMTLSPFEWAGMFRYIDLVVTERFHDSVFAMRNGKTAVAIDWNQKRFSKDGFSKTQNLLSQYGLDCNHFIFKESDDLQGIMQHIKTLDFEKQGNIIKRHNLDLAEKYELILEKIGHI